MEELQMQIDSILQAFPQAVHLWLKGDNMMHLCRQPCRTAVHQRVKILYFFVNMKVQANMTVLSECVINW